MSTTLKRSLWLWGGLLALILSLFWLPLSSKGQIVALIILLIIMVTGWLCIGKKTVIDSSILISLPSEHFRNPIIIVCGDDIDKLFGDENRRETPQGCYLRLPAHLALADFVAVILSQRMSWSNKLSVLRIINPQQHQDEEILAGEMREFCHQISHINQLCGCIIPTLLTSYLFCPKLKLPNEQWFEWSVGESQCTVGVERTLPQTLEHWLTDGSHHAQTNQQERFKGAVIAKSWCAWMGEFVLPHCINPKGTNVNCSPLTISLSLINRTFSDSSTLSHREHTNTLWQQWLKSKTTLTIDASIHNIALTQSHTDEQNHQYLLPFPDRLLRLLPQQIGFTPIRKASAWATGLFTLAIIIALCCSAWNNHQLLSRIHSDVMKYQSLNEDDYHEKEQGLEQLKQDVVELEGYEQSLPWRMEFSFYHSDRFLLLIKRLIKEYQPRPIAQETVITPEPKSIHLDSLSLFATGSAQLKSGSTKILIGALVGIKAEPGWLIVIVGHTDSTGDELKNRSLSLARAEAVRDWMLNMGDIPITCFAVQGYGSSQPIMSNSTNEGRAANRRVEIRLLPDARACQPLNEATDD